MFSWIRSHEELVGWLLLASMAVFLGSLVAIPWLVVRLPADYFAGSRRQLFVRTEGHYLLRAVKHPLLKLLGLAVKNFLGGLLLLVGAAMLVLPGQGVLTILVGIMLLDFPGKYRLERWVVSRRPVLRSINWLRRRAHREPIVIEESP